MKRSIFNVSYIFALKSFFFEKNKIEWNQTDRHTMYMTFSFYYFWVLKFDIKCVTNFRGNYQSKNKIFVKKMCLD